jgi:superfamily II DNA/RNA helicase
MLLLGASSLPLIDSPSLSIRALIALPGRTQSAERRQTLLFSATMPRRVERLAADALTSPVRVTVGEVGGANEDIKQVSEGCGQYWPAPGAALLLSVSGRMLM